MSLHTQGHRDGGNLVRDCGRGRRGVCPNLSRDGLFFATTILVVTRHRVPRSAGCEHPLEGRHSLDGGRDHGGLVRNQLV